MNDKLSLQDINVGMSVKFNQLSNIYDTWILEE